MKNKKTFTLTLIGLFIFLFGVIGLTYAYWSRTLTQTEENLVYTDCLKLTTSLTDTGSFTLEDAYPMTNEELVREFFPKQTPYHFTITNECESDILLSINMESLTTTNPQLKDDYVDIILWEGTAEEHMVQDETQVLSHVGNRREIGSTVETPSYKLTNHGVNESKIIEEANTAYQLYSFKLPGKKDDGSADNTKEFNLLLFMDYDTPVDGTIVNGEEVHTNNANWAGKITLNNYEPMPNTLRKINTYFDYDNDEYYYDTTGMWKYKNQITKIIFQDTINPPEGYTYEFDESVDQDGTVKSYLVPNDNGHYIAYIQSNGKIKANPDSSYLFAEFEYVETIEGLDYLDTSNVTNMSHMFFGVSVSELNLNSFDTRNVTNMSRMFAGIGVLELDLSHFDTSQVTDMSGMFDSMYNLQTLTLGDKFDTSHVTDMSGMFAYTENLVNLDLSQAHFDTSQVIDMSGMFENMEDLQTLTLGDLFHTNQVKDMSDMFYCMFNLTSLDVSHFDTSNVTNMSEMFRSVSSITTLDVSHFNTSQVTDMVAMFYGMNSLQTLTLSKQFNTSQVTNMNYMFTDMSDLTNLDLSQAYFDTSKITNMIEMFSGMNSLQTLTLGDKFDTSQVIDMSSMFSGMSQLTSLDLSTFDTRKVGAIADENGEYGSFDYMFDGDILLTDITYGENFVRMNNASVSSMFGNGSAAPKPSSETWQGLFD